MPAVVGRHTLDQTLAETATINQNSREILDGRPRTGASRSPSWSQKTSSTMTADPLALQLRNLQTMVEIGVDKNSTIMFPAPLMSTIQEWAPSSNARRRRHG